MSKFIFIYRGPATPMDQFTEAQSAEQRAAWGAWMGKVGSALVDGGAPFGNHTSLRDDGSVAEAADLTGYTVLEAESLEAATALADGHPFLSEGQGRFNLDIFELMEM